jgi:hypothetical protein
MNSKARLPKTALQFLKHLLGGNVMPTQGDDGVEPQIGHLIDKRLGTSIFRRHQYLCRFFHDLLQDVILASRHQ